MASLAIFEGIGVKHRVTRHNTPDPPSRMWDIRGHGGSDRRSQPGPSRPGCTSIFEILKIALGYGRISVCIQYRQAGESVMPTPDEHQALSRRRRRTATSELAHVGELRQRVAVVALPPVRQTPLPLRAERGPWTWAQYWSVTRAVHGKTQFRSIAPHAGAPDRGADRGVPSLSTPDPGVCRCQHPLV